MLEQIYDLLQHLLPHRHLGSMGAPFFVGPAIGCFPLGHGFQFLVFLLHRRGFLSFCRSWTIGGFPFGCRFLVFLPHRAHLKPAIFGSRPDAAHWSRNKTNERQQSHSRPVGGRSGLPVRFPFGWATAYGEVTGNPFSQPSLSVFAFNLGCLGLGISQPRFRQPRSWDLCWAAGQQASGWQRARVMVPGRKWFKPEICLRFHCPDARSTRDHKLDSVGPTVFSSS